MEILHTRPPNFDKIFKVFPMASMPGVIFTYAPNIYVPSGHPLSQALLEHERVHLRQQSAMGVEQWWDKYLIDPEFRYQQELEAHRVEYRAVLQVADNRLERRQALVLIAKRLASGLYGRVVTTDQAKKAILA